MYIHMLPLAVRCCSLLATAALTLTCGIAPSRLVPAAAAVKSGNVMEQAQSQFEGVMGNFKMPKLPGQ